MMSPLVTALPPTLACNHSLQSQYVWLRLAYEALTLSRNLVTKTQIPLHASMESYTSMQPLTIALATSTATPQQV